MPCNIDVIYILYTAEKYI